MHPDHARFLDPKNDFAFKRVFGREENKDILIAFLNDILDHEYIGKIIHVDFLPTIQNPDIAAYKESILDVMCQDQHGLQYIIEMQLARTTGFIKRAQYYATKAYSKQLLQGEQYDQLKEVIFLAITDFILFPHKTDIKSDHIILDRKTKEHDLRDLYFTFVELPKFTKKIDELTSITEKWYYYLKHAPATLKAEYEQLIKDAPMLQRAYEELDKYAWNEAELNTYEDVLKRNRDNASVRQYAIEKAKAAGMKKGMERGMKKGIKQGKAERELEIARQMLQSGMPLEQIQRWTGLSLEELKAIQ